MNGPDPKDADRYYRAYQRLVALSLAFAVVIGAYFLAHILGYMGDRAERGALAIGGLYVAGFVGLKIGASGARVWGRRDPFIRAIWADEWSKETRNRASRTALGVTLGAQLPLALLLANAAPRSSPAGMGALTVSLGIAAFFAAYLCHGRQTSDG